MANTGYRHSYKSERDKLIHVVKGCIAELEWTIEQIDRYLAPKGEAPKWYVGDGDSIGLKEYVTSQVTRAKQALEEVQREERWV